MIEFIGWLVLGISVGLVYGILALGIVLVFKGTKVINFSHPFMGLVTAYVAWWLTSKAGFLPFDKGSTARFLLAGTLALALTALNGLGLERSVFHRLRNSSRLTQLVATIAVGSGQLGLVIFLFERNPSAGETRTLPTVLDLAFSIGNVRVTPAYVQIFLVVPAIAAGLYWFFQKTRFGVGVRAAAENPDAARLLGISADRVSQFTWVTGAVLAGVAALLIVPISSLDSTTLSTGFLVRALAAALVGGLVSLPGAIVGGLIVGVTQTMTTWQSGTPGLPETLMFALVLVVLIVRPGGLFGQREETTDSAAFVPALRDLPLRLRAHELTPWVGRYWFLTAALFVLGLGQVVGGATNGILVTVIAYALVGVSLTVLMGFSGQISLGHWGLAGVGSFATANYLGRLDLPFVAVVPLVMVTGMVVALLIGLPALRIRGLYLAIVTLAFSAACELYVFKTGLVAGGSSAGLTVDGPKLGPLDLDAIDGRGLLTFSVAVLAFAIWVARNLTITRTGRGFFALRENERAAAVLGIDSTRYRLLAFAVSGGIAALGGMIYALQLGTITSADFTTSTSLVLVSMVVIGGLGSVEGSVLGALAVFGLPELLHFANGWIVEIGTGVLLLVVILRAPAGLAGLLGFLKRELVDDLVTLAESERRPAAAGTP